MRQGHAFLDESHRVLGRTEGFEACRALWAISDAKAAVSDFISAANRISAAKLAPEDRAEVESMLQRAQLCIDLLRSLS